MFKSSFMLAAALAATAVAHAPAAAEPLKKITVIQMHPVMGVGEEAFLYAIPKRLGYFKAEGLDVDIQNGQNGAVAAQVIQSGGAQFGTTAPEAIMQVREQGGDIISVYDVKQNGGTFMVVLKESPIHDLKDLKGKTIGAPSFGSGGGLTLKANLAAIGIAPDQYTAIATGAGPSALAALRTRQIDALVMWDAMLGAAENTGLELRKIDIPFQDRLAGMTLATTASFAKANPKAVEGYCRAIAKGVHFTMTSPEAAVRVLWDEFPTIRPATLDEATALKNHAHIIDRFLEMAEQGLPYGARTGGFIAAQWQYSHETYTASGFLKGTGTAGDAYTTRFLDACNAFDRDAVAADAKKY